MSSKAKLDAIPAESLATNMVKLQSKLKNWGGQMVENNQDYMHGTARIGIVKDGRRYVFQRKEKTAKSAAATLAYSIVQLINLDIRGIFPFASTAKDYLRIEGPSFKPGEEPQDGPAENYAALGLEMTASNDQVMSAYKRLMREYHPDHAPPGAEAEFGRKAAEISAAYTEIKKNRGF